MKSTNNVRTISTVQHVALCIILLSTFTYQKSAGQPEILDRTEHEFEPFKTLYFKLQKKFIQMELKTKELPTTDFYFEKLGFYPAPINPEKVDSQKLESFMK
jgi:hypothetical protein